GNDGDAPNVDAQRAKLAAEVRGVQVLDLAGEDLVADEDDPGGLRHGCTNFTMLECARPRTTPMTLTADPIRLDGWALVLGASSGFGAATSVALARAGLNVFGVHLDRKATMPNAERVIADVEAAGREAIFWNANAADADKRA